MAKRNHQKFGAALLAGLLSAALLSGCGSPAPAETPSSGGQEATEINGQSRTYELSGLGMTVTLPEALLQRMEQDVAVYAEEQGTEDGSALAYGLLSWQVLPEGQTVDTAENLRLEDTRRAGVLGVYQAGLAGLLDSLTGCAGHEKLGESPDGAYLYYLSLPQDGGGELAGLLQEMEVTITEMADYTPSSGSAGGFPAGTPLGEFTTQDVNGNPFTQALFQDYDLTLVNIFATWCSPCVAEIPDLQALREAMADRGVNVVGFVLDARNEKGEIDEEALEKARLLAERTGAEYPFLVPDGTLLNGRLANIQAVPETFFVDRNGTIVGSTYSGSASLEDWTRVVEQELAALEGNPG